METLAVKLRLVLWAHHQRYVALILLVCLLGMTVFFLHQRYSAGGLIDIDRSPPLNAEFKVDLNQADWTEIVILPGVGQKLARAIVSYRKSHGAFESAESLLGVPGIGPKKLDQLRPYLLPIGAKSR